MPTYDYLCEENNQVYEVSHSMSLEVKDWGHLCELLEIETGSIDPKSTVTKMINRSFYPAKGIPDMPCVETDSCDVPACKSGGCQGMGF